MSEKTDSRRRNEPRGGSIIADRYQVDRLIARGGMAAVYLAQHIKLNRPIALKILSPPPDADDAGAFEERFRLEAETLASLDHGNIVILHDFGETEDGRFFLAMEYVDGRRLSDLLRDGPLSVDRALGLIMQVCAALRYAHKRGLVHRDLKPSNLLIRVKDDGSEQVKVVDFGLVKLTEADQSITRAGLILGSPHCMAPEQVKGLDVDHRADIYAIGILIYRCLTGHYPFHGPNSAATMIAHLNQTVPTFFSVAPSLVVPPGLEEIARRCLEKDPDDRFQSMADLMDAIGACMNIAPENFRSVSQSHSTIQRATGEGGRDLRLPIAVGAVALLLMLGVAGALGIATFLGDPSGGAGPTSAEEKPPTASPDQGTAEASESAEAPTGEPPEAAPSARPLVAPSPAPDAGTTEPAPAAAPAPAPRPAPIVTPKPEPTAAVAPKPAPETAPAPAPEPLTTEAPPGYEGLPKEFWPDAEE